MIVKIAEKRKIFGSQPVAQPLVAGLLFATQLTFRKNCLEINRNSL